MQMLLSFDSDKDPSNGISIDESIHDIVDQEDLEFTYYAESNPEEVTYNVKDIKLWLYNAQQQSLIVNQALYSPEVSLTWAATQLIPELTIYAIVQENTYNTDNTISSTSSYEYNDLGFTETSYEDDTGSTHNNSRSVQTYNQYGHELTEIESERDDGVDEWTITSTETKTRNEHSWQTQEIDSFANTGDTYRYEYEYTDAGGMTLFESYNNDELRYIEKNIYQNNLVYLKNKLKQNFVNSIQTSIQSFNERGLLTLNLYDIDSDGTANFYDVTTYTDRDERATYKGYSPVSFTYDPRTFVATITEASPTLEYEETQTYDNDGNLISHVQTSTVDCQRYQCDNVTYTYNYTNGLLTSYDQTYPTGQGSDTAVTQEFYEGTDVVKKRTFIQEGLNAYTQVREFNSAGQVTRDEYDAVDDNGTHSLYTRTYSDDFFILERKDANTQTEILSEIYATQTYVYDSNDLVTNILSDWDKDGFYEEEHALSYDNGLVVEWIRYDIDPNTEEKTIDRKETYSYTAANFNYGSR
jgi:hypothetical protein